MVRKIFPVLALIMLIVAFWPNTLSPYGLTGEVELPGQLRGALQWLYSSVRPQPDQGIGEGIEHADISPFGMNTFLEQEVLPEVREKTLVMLNEANFSFIRQQFPWEDIEIHGKGDFIDRRNDPAGVDSWLKYDNIVDLAEQNGIEIIARLDNPPAWSRVLTDTIGTHAPPDNFEDYGDFVETVVDRYRGRIRYFQIWNEPNIYPEWGEQAVDPELFTELLCTAFKRAKSVNPEAVILAGALSPTVALNFRDLNDLIFLQRMYQTGAGECFDILSAQGYGLWSGPTDQRLRPTVINYPHVIYLRDVMVKNGESYKPIWISEAGWNAVPAGMPDPYGRVNSEQQARFAVDAYKRAQTEWPWLGVVNYWFFKRPSDADIGQPFYYFRILEPDFTPTETWDVLKAYTSSAAAGEISPKSPAFYTWQQLRPYLAMIAGAVLLFWLLNYLSPR